jgi:hypothetical protein
VTPSHARGAASGSEGKGQLQHARAAEAGPEPVPDAGVIRVRSGRPLARSRPAVDRLRQGTRDGCVTVAELTGDGPLSHSQKRPEQTRQWG